MLFADDPQDDMKPIALEAKDNRLIISAGNCLALSAGQAIFYSLASWGQDDVIEYLLSAHSDRCASVMARLKCPMIVAFLKGIPELWIVVLDRMACDDSIGDVRAAIRGELSAWFEKHPRARAVTEDFCLTGIGQDANLVLNLALSSLSGDTSTRVHYAEELLRLVRHRPVALLLAADRIKDLVERATWNRFSVTAFPMILSRKPPWRSRGTRRHYNT